MRIEFDQKGFDFLEVKKSPGGVAIIVSSKDWNNPRSAIVNSAEVTTEQFIKIVKSLGFFDEPSDKPDNK